MSNYPVRRTREDAFNYTPRGDPAVMNVTPSRDNAYPPQQHLPQQHQEQMQPYHHHHHHQQQQSQQQQSRPNIVYGMSNHGNGGTLESHVDHQIPPDKLSHQQQYPTYANEQPPHQQYGGRDQPPPVQHYQPQQQPQQAYHPQSQDNYNSPSQYPLSQTSFHELPHNPQYVNSQYDHSHQDLPGSQTHGPDTDAVRAGITGGVHSRRQPFHPSSRNSCDSVHSGAINSDDQNSLYHSGDQTLYGISSRQHAPLDVSQTETDQQTPPPPPPEVNDYASNTIAFMGPNKSKTSKYGSKSSTAAMSQYSHRPPQEKSLHHIQDMRSYVHGSHAHSAGSRSGTPGYTVPAREVENQHQQQQQQQQQQPSTWQSTRDTRRMHQGHSSASSYRSLPEATSTMSIRPTSHSSGVQQSSSSPSSWPGGQPRLPPESLSSSSPSPPVDGDSESGVDLNSHDFIQWAKLQDPHDISDSLDRDPSLMTKTDAGSNSLLHGGAEVGNISLVDFLLKRLSAKDARRLLHSFNKDGLEPLHVATTSGMFHIIKKLLKFDASLSGRTTKDRSSLLHVAVTAHAPLSVVQHLIGALEKQEGGTAAVWATDATGSTPLHLACMEGNIPVMSALLDVAGADVNFPDGQKRSCLHISIILGHTMMTKALLALDHPFKPAIEQTGTQNNTSLHYACSNHQYNLIKLLLEHGANTNAKNKMKLTPSELGNDEIIDLLFANKEKYMPKKVTKPSPQKTAAGKRAGSKKNQAKGKTTVDSDEEDGESEEDEEEENEGEEDEEEEEEEEEEEDDSEEEEEEEEGNQDATDEDLFESVKVGCIADLEAVIGTHDDLRRNVNKIRDSESKATLLHAAAKHGHLDVAQFLVEGAGASVDLKDEYGMTPLHCAVESQQLLVVRYLVKYCGARLDVKDNAGNLAVDLADEEEAEDEENVEEICRIIQNSLKKPPSKRKLVKTPVISKQLI